MGSSGGNWGQQTTCLLDRRIFPLLLNIFLVSCYNLAGTLQTAGTKYLGLLCSVVEGLKSIQGGICVFHNVWVCKQLTGYKILVDQ